MTKILLIGKSARIDCIADTLARSPREPTIYALLETRNPGLIEKIKCRGDIQLGSITDLDLIGKFASKIKPDFAIIGSEDSLAAGVVDKLTNLGISCLGPTQKLAQLESSKAFTRTLLTKYSIPGNPEYRIFRTLDGIETYLKTLPAFVIKPDGLTGGKGVKVFGEHLYTIEDGLKYSEQILNSSHRAVVIEEFLDGEEFSLQTLSDGIHTIDTVVVQDHKRAYEGDKGPNTGGMGSYSCANHQLPFLSQDHIKKASFINSSIAHAIKDELGEEYKGVIYGGFIITRDGLRVIEYNARFGDPEALNILPILKGDFVNICEALIHGSLHESSIEFENKATVCKYVVPKGYPLDPERNQVINIDDNIKSDENLRIYYGSIEKKHNGLYMMGSRAIAFVGIGNNLENAEMLAEAGVRTVKGSVRHRSDIGTSRLIQDRIDHMKEIF